jgi:excisionase family DNA binding protein
MVSEAEYWSVFDAAVFYGVSTWTIRRMVKSGELLHTRVRGSIRIPRERPGFTPVVKITPDKGAISAHG